MILGESPHEFPTRPVKPPVDQIHSTSALREGQATDDTRAFSSIYYVSRAMSQDCTTDVVHRYR
jgi:hypothetical protein